MGSSKEMLTPVRPTSVALLALLSVGCCQELYRTDECTTDSQCIKGPGRCVQKKVGLFCGLFNNCRSYGRCVECMTDSHCKKYYNLDDCISNYCFLKDYFRNPEDRIEEDHPVNKIQPGLPIYPRIAPIQSAPVVNQYPFYIRYF